MKTFLPLLLLASLAAGCATTQGPRAQLGEREATSPPPAEPESARPCPPAGDPVVRDLTRDWRERRYIGPNGESCRP